MNNLISDQKTEVKKKQEEKKIQFEDKKLKALTNVEDNDNHIDIQLKQDLNNIVKKDLSEIEPSQYVYNKETNMYEDLAQKRRKKRELLD